MAGATLTEEQVRVLCAFGKASGLRCAARAMPPARPRAPRSPVRECSDPRTADDLAEAFLAGFSGELSSGADAWGGKLGYSIFDEEEVLGRLDTEDPETFDAGLDAALLEVAALVLGAEPAAEVEPAAPHPQEPGDTRAVRLVEPLCCVETLERQLPDGCAVCCEALLAGQRTWRLPCMHVFHEVCMRRCFARRRVTPRCPLCRCSVKHAAASSAPLA